MILISLHLDEHDIDRIEYLVKQKMFPNRSECIRSITRQYLDNVFDRKGILAGFRVGGRLRETKNPVPKPGEI